MKVFLLLLSLCFSKITYGLINGVSYTGPFPTVQLEFKMKSHFCSGTFIDSHTILTAAHCITKPKKKWSGFSLDLEAVALSSGKKISFVFDRYIAHPLYRAGDTPSKNDVGIIKFKSTSYRGSYPRISFKTTKKVILYGCGVINLKTRDRRCHRGSNDLHSFMGHFFTIGESSRSKPYGENVSVAWNDSGGALVNSDTGEMIGVHWGAWIDFPAKWSLPSISFMTSFSEKSNIEFINSHIEKYD